MTRACLYIGKRYGKFALRNDPLDLRKDTDIHGILAGFRI